MVLSQEEIDGCRDAFLAFDKDRSGTIDVWELRQVLEAMGQKPTEEELFQMISEVDENMSGSIDFAEFLKVSVDMGGWGFSKYFRTPTAMSTDFGSQLSVLMMSSSMHNQPPELVASDEGVMSS